MEHIIATMTTWSKRIHNVLPVLKRMEAQTIKPYKIVLNVCIQDFPDMLGDFPDDLVEYITSTDNIEVYWYLENYKGWKKHLHVLETAGPDDLIFCFDDDHLYPENFIEKLYRSYCHYGKKYPVTYARRGLINYLWSFSGFGSIYRVKDWGNYKKYLTDDILRNTLEDYVINAIFWANGTLMLPMIYEFPHHAEFEYNAVEPLTTDSSDGVTKARESIQLVDNIAEKHFPRGYVYTYFPKMWEISERFIHLLRHDPDIKDIPTAQYIIKADAAKKGLKTFTPVEESFIQTYLSNTL